MVEGEKWNKKGSSTEFLQASERASGAAAVGGGARSIPSTALLRDAPRLASCSTGRAAALSGGKRADTSMSFLSHARNRLPGCDLYRPGEEQPSWEKKKGKEKINVVFPRSAVSWQDVLTSCCVFNCAPTTTTTPSDTQNSAPQKVFFPKYI